MRQGRELCMSQIKNKDKEQKLKPYLQRMQLQKDEGSILMISLMMKRVKVNK